MSDYLQPGLHPDPDRLNAFVEGVLPEHERLQCLTHLAECPVCREVVYLVEQSLLEEPRADEPLATEPVASPVAPERVPFWKRWFTPIPALSAAMAVGTLVLSFALYQHFRPSLRAPEMAAMPTHPSEQPASEPQEKINQPMKDSVSGPKINRQAQKSMAVTETTASRRESPIATADSGKTDAVAQTVPARGEVTTGPAPAAAAPPPPISVPIAAPPPASNPELAAAPPATSPAMSPAKPQALQIRAAPSASPAPATFASVIGKDSASQTGVAGTIVDPAGAVIAGATVKLRPLTTPASRSLTSDPKGQFNVAGLEPGRYELQVYAPGFKQLTEQIDIRPNQMARADSTLSIGSVSETISVTAETSRVQTATGSVAAQSAVQPLPNVRSASKMVVAGILDPAVTLLPSRLPASTTVVKGKVMLATDSAGALFASQNAGKKWAAVKPVWGGKVVGLVALSATDSPSGAAFQLTTDGGVVWLSRDGNRWYAAPAQR